MWQGRIADFATRMGVTILGTPIAHPYHDADYERAFAKLREENVGAILIGESIDSYARRNFIAELVARSRLPALYPQREYVSAGGLMAYSPDPAELGRHMGRQIAQIFRGESPANIPIYQASKFHLIVNLKTAQTLGIEFPPPLLTRADEVIE